MQSLWNGLGYALCAAIVFSIIYWTLYSVKRMKQGEKEPEPDYTDFSYLTIKEKVDKVAETRNQIGALENLLTDLSVCNPDNVKVVRVKWMSETGKVIHYDLYCDGTDTATENLYGIAEREIHDLKIDFSHYSEILAEAARNNKNDYKNVVAENRKQKWGRVQDALRDFWAN